MNDKATQNPTGPNTPPSRARRIGRLLWLFLVEIPFKIALAAGVCFIIAELHFSQNNTLPSASDEPDEPEEQLAYDDWQRQGPVGWERLFECASKGWPGYIVDVGRPPRLKLTALGAKVRPLMLEKLESPEYAERITAIQVLASVGEPSARIVQLLAREIKNATRRQHEVGVLKCATTLPDWEASLIRLSLIALGSRHPKTRMIAVEYLLALRRDARAPRDLDRRLLALLNDEDIELRLVVASFLAKEGAPYTYRVLLAGLNSRDSQTVMLAAQLVAWMRGQQPLNTGKLTQKALNKAIEKQRRWLKPKAL